MKFFKRRTANLQFAFMAGIFIVLLITALAAAPFGLFLAHFKPFGPNPVMPVVAMMLFSVILGTFIFGMVSKTILKPINDISEATKAVATGDFTVRLDETQYINELHDIFTNFNFMVQELSSIETLQNDFVLNVSHEFKTPIAAIEGCALLLQDESATSQERKEYASMIVDATKKLSSLTGNILRISKLESSDASMETAPYSLDEQLRQAILQLEKDWTDKQIDVSVDLDQVTYNGNEELLLQVWLNLLTNAIKYSEPGSKIAVSLYRTSSGCSIQVEDSGIGISGEELRHIFDKFYQADTSRKSQGNGLGLALVQRIVQRHNGSITVKSTPGSGSVFTVRLPKK